MSSSPESEYSLDTLGRKAGVPLRTIRFYIAQNLMPPPLRAGRGAAYGPLHLERLKGIQTLKQKGLTLTEIRQALDPEPREKCLPAPVTVWSYQISGDVTGQVRAGGSPWRMKRIQKAINELARRLGQPEEDGES